MTIIFYLLLFLQHASAQTFLINYLENSVKVDAQLARRLSKSRYAARLDAAAHG